MSTYAAATCGFLPLHLYEGVDLDRANEIVAAINAFALEEFGLATADPRRLIDLSLQQLLDAVRLVDQRNDAPKQFSVPYTSTMVPDDRLTAAVYTLIHFQARRAGADDDNIPVRFRQKRYGDEIVHFLCVGARDADQLASEDEDTNEETV